MNEDALLLAEMSRTLRNRRKAKRLTQKQLADLCTLSENTIVLLEAGANVHLLTILRVARELDVRVTVTS